MPVIDGIDVDPSAGMPTWEQSGQTYHLNITTDPPHITWEAGGKIGKRHYFFEAVLNARTNSYDIKSKTGGKGTFMFNKLPDAVQNFIEKNYEALLALTR